MREDRDRTSGTSGGHGMHCSAVTTVRDQFDLVPPPDQPLLSHAGRLQRILATPLMFVFSLTTTYNIIVLFSFVMGVTERFSRPLHLRQSLGARRQRRIRLLCVSHWHNAQLASAYLTGMGALFHPFFLMAVLARLEALEAISPVGSCEALCQPLSSFSSCRWSIGITRCTA